MVVGAMMVVLEEVDGEVSNALSVLLTMSQRTIRATTLSYL
jgi:hypothetical protein